MVCKCPFDPASPLLFLHPHFPHISGKVYCSPHWLQTDKTDIWSIVFRVWKLWWIFSTFFSFFLLASKRVVFLSLHGHLTIIHARQGRQGRYKHPGFSSLLWQAVTLFLRAATFNRQKSIFSDLHDCQKWTHMNERCVGWELQYQSTIIHTPYLKTLVLGTPHPVSCLI